MPDAYGEWTEDEIETKFYILQATALMHILDAIGDALAPAEKHLDLGEIEATPWDQAAYLEKLREIGVRLNMEPTNAEIAARAEALLQSAVVSGNSRVHFYPK